MEEIASKDLKKTEEEEKKKIVAEVLQVNLFKFVDISPHYSDSKSLLHI